MTIFLNDCVDEELGCSSCIIVGSPDASLVFRLEQIREILRSFKSESLQFIYVVHDSQDTGVDSVPEIVLVLVDRSKKMHGIRCIISLQESFGSQYIVRVCRAAKPDVSRRIALFFLNLSLNFTSGKTLITCVNIEH